MALEAPPLRDGDGGPHRLDAALDVAGAGGALAGSRASSRRQSGKGGGLNKKVA